MTNSKSIFYRAIFAFFAVGIFGNLKAQTAILWQKSFGGTTLDEARCIRQTFDGGYIVAGCSFSNDGDVTGHHGNNQNGDAWITRLDSNGNLLWQQSYGGSSGDGVFEIEQTRDSGFIMVGSTTSSDGDLSHLAAQGNSGYPDIWVVKIDAVGLIQWQQIWNNGSVEQGYSMQQTGDGGYIVCGTIYSNADSIRGFYDYGLMKLDDTGGIQWKKVYGGHNCENAASVRQTNDGGYILAGASNSNDGDVTVTTDNYDYWILKLDSVGAIQWQQALGTGNDEGDCFNSKIAQIRQCRDSGFILSGYSYMDYYVARTNRVGSEEWHRILGSTGIDCAQSIEQTTDGGYILAGYAGMGNGDVPNSYHDKSDYWIVKLDSSGLIEASQCLGGSQADLAYSVQQSRDGGYIVAGSSGSTDGDVTGNHGDVDFWVVKLDRNLLSVPKVFLSNDISVWPNPVGDIVNVECLSGFLPASYYICDMQGRKLQEGYLNDIKENFSVSLLASGVYILRVGNRTFKLVKQ